MAHENRKDSGFGGRGFRGDERRGRGGRGSRFGNSERDRSPLRDGRFRDRYADSYHGGGGPRRNYSEAGDFGPRESYYPDPYRRPYPDPWIGDDQYRRDPYADPYRDHYSSRTPALPPVIECDIFVTDSQLRIYGETVERKIKEHNVLTAVSILPDTRTPSQLVEELTAQGGLFAIFINPQNEIHRSLTLNILHGTPQEHRNMPLDDAIALVGHSFVKYVDDLRERAQASAAPQPSSTANRVFLPPSSEVAYLLNLLADNRAVTVAELNTVIKYLQDRRDKLIDAESRPILTNAEDFGKTPPLPHQEQPQLQNPPSQENAQTNSKDITPSHQDLTNKILGLFASAGGNIQGVPPANGTQQPAASAKVPTGTPAPPQVPVPSSASLINFDNPNVQKALDNLIQSTPSLLKNINTKNPLSATPLGAPGISGNIGAMGSGIFGQMGGMAAGPTQGSQPQGQMQGNQNQAGLQVGYGGMQGQRGPGVGQGLSGFSAQSFFNMSGGQGNMGRNYGQPSQPRY